MPTYTSWLNPVEIWFSKIEHDVIARGVSTAVDGCDPLGDRNAGP